MMKSRVRTSCINSVHVGVNVIKELNCQACNIIYIWIKYDRKNNYEYEYIWSKITYLHAYSSISTTAFNALACRSTDTSIQYEY